MSEIGSIESGTPDEGSGGAQEQASEAVREQFVASAKQAKQQAKDERKARKRDDSIAKTIIQFLGDDAHSHLFPLISRLVARDCPSIFILALLSLIHEPSKTTVEEYVREQRVLIDIKTATLSSELDTASQEELLLWISRLQLVLTIDGIKVLSRLMLDEDNMDGTILQLTNHILIEFFHKHHRIVTADKLQPLTVSILQNMIEPFLDKVAAYFAEERRKMKQEDD
jgi:hypothetical protein